MAVARMVGRVSVAAVALVTAFTVGVVTTGSAAAGAGVSSPAVPTAAPPAGGPAPSTVRAPSAVLATGQLPAAVLHTQPKLETTFVAVAPCRIVDTRHGGGALTNGAARTFHVAGTFGFAPQGGLSGGCGVPLGATAVSVNVTTTASAANGYLTGYAVGTTPGTSNFTSYRPGENITVNPVLPLAGVSTQQLTVRASGGATQLVMDVTGYYVDQIEALISTAGGASAVYSGSPRVLSVVNTAAGTARVTIDRDVTFCTIGVTSYFSSGVYANALGFSTNTVTVYTWYIDSSTHNAVSANNYAYLTITC